MANWSKNKTLPANINNGNEYAVDDNVTLEDLNAITNNSFYAMGMVDNLSNPNLLINGDFRVNQRGLPSYDAGTGAMYCVDHWWLSQAAFTVATKSLTTTSSWRGMLQYIENWEVLKGKTVTASIKATSGASGIRFGLKNSTSDLIYTDGLVNSTGVLSVTFTIPSNASYTNLNVAIWNKGAETTTIEYIKLELGEVATNFCPRPYSEELAMCQMPFDRNGISTTYSNPNLLINGDFRVNQRGESTYNNTNAATGKYTVDRWIHYNNGDYTLSQVDGGGVTVANTGTLSNIDFAQIIEDGAKMYGGKLLTLSCKVDGVISSFSTSLTKGDSSYTAIKKSNNEIVGYLYIQWVNNSSNTFKVWFNVSKGKSYTIDYVKLEVGEVATPFSPRPYAEELQMCQRYYQKIQYKSGTYGGFINFGFLRTDGLRIQTFYPLLAELRTTPTLRINGTLQVVNMRTNTITTPTLSTDIYILQKNQIGLQFTANSSLGNGGDVCLIFPSVNTGYIELDAEL